MRPSVSEAYLTGFNTRAGVVLIVAVLAGFAYWTGGLGLSSPAPTDSPAPGLRWRQLGISLAIFTLILGAEWAAARHRIGINELPFQVDRLQHLMRGEVPYRQFEFSYGPAFLYFPALLVRVLHLPLVDGYFLAWTLEYLAGIALIWDCVRLLPATGRSKPSIFLLTLLTFSTLHVSMGQQYTPFRFFLLPWLALRGFRLLSGELGTRAAFAGSTAGIIALLLVSPEQAIALAFGVTVLLALRWRHERKQEIVLLLAGNLLCAVAILAVADRAGLFLTLRNMSRGGYNFPLVPHTTELGVFLVLLTASCVLWNDVRRNAPPTVVTLLVLLNVPLLPAAFGRSDPGHLFINTVPATLAAWTVLSFHPVAWRRAKLVWLFAVVLIPGAFLFRMQSRIVQEYWSGPPRVALSVPAPDTPRVLFSPFQPPLLTQPPPGLPEVRTGFYFGLENLSDPSEVPTLVSELRSTEHPALLVPEPFACIFTFDPVELRQILGAPLVPHGRHRIDFLEPICDEIRSDYVPTHLSSPYAGFRIWLRR